MASSSPVIPRASKLDHGSTQILIENFAAQSMHDDPPLRGVTRRPCNGHSRVVMESIIDSNSKQQSSVPFYATDPFSNALPPSSQHMEYYAKRAARRFRPYQSGEPSALEHRFTTKNILKRNEADISLIDVSQVLSPSTPQVASY